MREVKQRRTSGLSRRNIKQSSPDTDTKLNKTRHPSSFNKKQGYAIGIITLLILGIPFLGWTITGPLAHSYTCNPTPQEKLNHLPCNDPTTFIWQSTTPNNNIAEFNSLLAVYATPTRDAITYKSIQLNPNSTTTAVAISKTPTDLSTISGKQLWALFGFSASAANTGTSWGMFITTNNTLPTQHNYDPNNDKNIALLMKIVPQGAGNYLLVLSFQRRIGESIGTEDTGGCASGGSCYLKTTYTRDPTLHETGPEFFLNYTGAVNNGSSCSGVQGNSCSALEEAGSATFSTTQQLPWFQFQSQQYYIGFYNLFNNAVQVAWSFDTATTPTICGLGCMELNLYIATGTVPTQPPNVDTGGFFGPIIKALIGLGVWIVVNIISFFGYIFGIVASVIQQTLNIVGNFFSLGNLGDDLVNFFNGIANWLVNVFGAIIGQIGNIANGFSNAVAGLANLFTGWGTFLVNSLGVFGNIPTILLTIWNDALPAVYAVSFIIILWWIFGTYQAWRDFESGDFIAILPVLGMIFTLLLWLGSSVAFNPISANTTVTSAYSTAFNQTSWFLTILIPVFLVVMFGQMGNSGEHERHKSLEHYNTWLNMTHLIFSKIYTISFFIARESWSIIVSIKTLVWPT